MVIQLYLLYLKFVSFAYWYLLMMNNSPAICFLPILLLFYLHKTYYLHYLIMEELYQMNQKMMGHIHLHLVYLLDCIHLKYLYHKSIYLIYHNQSILYSSLNILNNSLHSLCLLKVSHI